MLKPSDRVADDLEQLLLKLIGDWYLLLQAKSVDRHQWRHIEGWMLSTPVRLNSGFKHIDDYRRTGKDEGLEDLYWILDGLWLSVLNGPHSAIVAPLRQYLFEIGGKQWLGLTDLSSLDRRLAKGVLGEQFGVDS
tara:strand:+ start:94 stop:498 length:405 start_codon:yes stop_codon:yes gene_type:complete